MRAGDEVTSETMLYPDKRNKECQNMYLHMQKSCDLVSFRPSILRHLDTESYISLDSRACSLRGAMIHSTGTT